MNEAQWKTALFTIGIFSLGAVGVILYQHSMHTGQILSAMGAGTSSTTAAPNLISAPPGQPASPAGTPTFGQDNLVNTPVIQPLQIGWNSGSGWLN